MEDGRAPSGGGKWKRILRGPWFWTALILFLVMIGLVITDWPLGWTVWKHPVFTHVVLDLLFLIIAVGVVDTYRRWREEQKWVDVGRVAAAGLYGLMNVSRITMLELLGLYVGPVWADIEVHLTVARKRVADVLPRDILDSDLSKRDPIDFLTDESVYAELRQERLPFLVQDEQWRDYSFMTIAALTRELETAIARWVSTFAVLGDSEGFRRVARSAIIFDLAEGVTEHMVIVQEGSKQDGKYPAAAVPDSVQALIDLWGALARAFVVEEVYWAKRQVAAAGLDTRELPGKTALYDHEVVARATGPPPP